MRPITSVSRTVWICGTESVPFAIDKIWAIVKRCPHVIGDFTWTSADYLGEAGIGCCFYHAPDDDSVAEMHLTRPYPWRAANDSDWDLCGFERPQLTAGLSGVRRRPSWRCVIPLTSACARI
ncbi:MAG: hypothetical protein ACLU9S_21360 [Oscillospiraceae bacterium]